MLARRRHIRVDEGLDRRIDVGVLAEPSVLRGVVGALHVLHGRRDVDEAAVLIDAIAERGVVGDPVEREVDLGGDALESEALDGLDQVGGQLARVRDLQEGAARVEGAHHDRSAELRAVVEHDSADLAALGDEAGHSGIEPDLCAVRRRRACKHLRESAVAALVEGPLAHEAVVLSHGEVEPVHARAR